MWSTFTRNALFFALTTSSSTAFVTVARPTSSHFAHRLHSSSSSSSSTNTADTPAVLPDFADKQDYLKYMETVSRLPRGFAAGTADGKFVSEEAPAMGNLPIRGTVIYLTEGATENWAAVFTSNRVRRTSWVPVLGV